MLGSMESSSSDKAALTKILRAYKTELDPTNGLRTLLLKHAGARRWAYNWGLQRKIEEYERTRKSPHAQALHRELNLLKHTDPAEGGVPWMYEVSKCAPQEALRDLDLAFVNFFENRSRFPRFKSRKQGIGGFRLTGAIRVQGKRARLPRLGMLRLKEHSAVEGRIVSAT